MTDREILTRLNKYIEYHDSELAIPFDKEFCSENDLDYETFLARTKRNGELKKAYNKMQLMRENIIQRGALNKTLDRSFATFALKQMGWKDQVEKEVTQHIDFNGDMRKWAK